MNEVFISTDSNKQAININVEMEILLKSLKKTSHCYAEKQFW